MTTQKRKIKRKYAANVADLMTIGALLPSQWGLAEADNTLVMRKSTGPDGNPSSYVLITGIAPSGNFINNGLTVQTADFNISGTGRVGSDFTVGSDILLTGGSPKISSGMNITLEANSGSIIMDTIGINGVLSVPQYYISSGFASPDVTPGNRLGSIYYDTDINKLRLLDNTGWIDLGTGGTGLPSLVGNAGKVLTVNPGETDVIWATAPGAGSGEANTASNRGYIAVDAFDPLPQSPEIGIGIYYTKNGVDLSFKSLLSGSGINLYNTDTDYRSITIENTHTITNIGPIVGTWISLYTGAPVVNDFQFKAIINASSGKLTITDDIDAVYFDINQFYLDLNNIGGPSNILSVSKGGTGTGNYAVGDLLYADSATSLGRLPISTNGKVLTLTGGLPSWTTPAFINPMTTLGDIIYGGVSGVGTRLGIGSIGDILTIVGGIPSWASPTSGPSNNDVAYLDPGNALKTTNVYWQTIGGAGSASSSVFTIEYTRFAFNKMVHIRVPAISITGFANVGSFRLYPQSGPSFQLPVDMQGFESSDPSFLLLPTKQIKFLIRMKYPDLTHHIVEAFWYNGYIEVMRADSFQNDFGAAGTFYIYGFELTYYGI